MGDAAPSLEETFLAHLAYGLGGRALPSGLGSSLARLVEEGRAAWGALDVGADLFVAQLASHIPADEEIAKALSRAHAADLHLACACANGVPGAAEALKRTYEPALLAYVRKTLGSSLIVDEVWQALLVKLLVGDGDRATIACFGGRGPLAAWLKIAAYRLGLNLLRSEGKLELTSLEALAGAIHDRDPELDLLRARYGEALRVALSDAFRGLNSHERVLVQLAYVEGMTHARISVMYRVNQSTITRRLFEIRERIAASVQRSMRVRAGVEPSELLSIVRLLGSQIDLSVARWLGPSGEEDDR